jgi:predicted amidophosphoribosyltransferase
MHRPWLAKVSFAVNWLFPGACPGCGKLEPAGICLACLEAGLQPVAAACQACGSPRACGACIVLAGPLDRVSALGAYAGILHPAIRQLKYDGRRDLAGPLGAAIGRLAIRLDPGAASALWVPIPAPPDRVRARGYDQAYLLARAASAAIGAPKPQHALRRTRNTPPLYAMTRSQRARLLEGVFCATGPLEGPVVLVDDVLTTGATASAAGAALRAAGADPVHLVVVARA